MSKQNENTQNDGSEKKGAATKPETVHFRFRNEIVCGRGDKDSTTNTTKLDAVTCGNCQKVIAARGLEDEASGRGAVWYGIKVNEGSLVEDERKHLVVDKLGSEKDFDTKQVEKVGRGLFRYGQYFVGTRQFIVRNGYGWLLEDGAPAPEDFASSTDTAAA